jgi:hypothetical protein
MARSATLAVGLYAMTAGCVALAGDMSCIGEQLRAAESRLDNLSTADQAHYGTAIAQLKKLAGAAEIAMAGAEVGFNRDFNEISRANPHASEAEKETQYAQQISQSADVDNRYADMLRAQYRVHMYEAEMIALSSRVPAAGDQEKMDAYADRQAQNTNTDYGALAESKTLRHLLGVAEASQEASNSGSAIPATGLARIGFDVSDPYGEAVVDGSRIASAAAVGAVSLQTAGRLRQDHLLAQGAGVGIGGREFHNAIDQGAPHSKSEASADMGGAINAQSVALTAFKEIARAATPDPPLPSASDAEKQSWAQHFGDNLKQKAQVVADIITIVKPAIMMKATDSTSESAQPPAPTDSNSGQNP